MYNNYNSYNTGARIANTAMSVLGIMLVAKAAGFILRSAAALVLLPVSLLMLPSRRMYGPCFGPRYHRPLVMRRRFW